MAEFSVGYPDTLAMREALDRYMAANGFSVRDYEAPTFTLRFWRFPVEFPNTAQRKRIVPFHDLHHILTEYGTDWIGEAEIGAWELRAGWRSLIAYFLNACGVVIGLFLAPGRVWRAFRAAKGQRTLYWDAYPYEQLLRMTVGELRERVGVQKSVRG